MLCVHLLLQVEKSPFVERLLKKGYEVLFLVEPVDEYCVQSLPEFEGKKFQNVAKEGLKLDQSEKAKEHKESLEKEFDPLLKWLKEDALKDKVGLNFSISDKMADFENIYPISCQKHITETILLSTHNMQMGYLIRKSRCLKANHSHKNHNEIR